MRELDREARPRSASDAPRRAGRCPPRPDGGDDGPTCLGSADRDTQASVVRACAAVMAAERALGFEPSWIGSLSDWGNTESCCAGP